MSFRSQQFLERLAEAVVIGDGAMGTELYRRGVAPEACFEHLNLVRPELIRAVHRDYLAAGAQLIETNTFGANALRLGAIGLEHKLEAINRAGVRLAREEAGETAFVAASVGPPGRPRGDADELPPAQQEAVLAQQMTVLVDAGVDLLLLETFADLADLELALQLAARLGLPAVAQLAFSQGGYTRDGVSAEDAARRLTAAGAAAVGANCGAGPLELLHTLRRMATATAAPLSAFPNAGFPEYVDGRSLYLARPDYFAERGAEMAAAGARLIGGCCGTTPDHIAALAAKLRTVAPTTRLPVAPPPTPSVPQPEAGPEPRPFFADWGRRPIVTVELDPPLGVDADGLLAKARRLAAAGVDAISLAENPLARIRMGNIAVARLIQEQTGVDVIAHITCRDRNLIGLHSDLLGAHLLGIRHVLAVTGDPVAVGGEVGAKGVFDLQSVGLLQLLSSLNRGQSLMGAPLAGHTSFIAGAAFNPNVPQLDNQLRKLERKVAAGARFVQTQPVYSPELLRELLARTADCGVPVLVGILPLVSERNAEFLHNEVPGISIPDAIRQRMRGKSGEAGVAEGLAIAAELVAAGRGLARGWYLMPPFGKVEVALRLLELIRETPSP